MSIQKKSLISTLQTAKKANVAAENKGEKQVSAVKLNSFARVHMKGVGKNLKTLKSVSTKVMG